MQVRAHVRVCVDIGVDVSMCVCVCVCACVCVCVRERETGKEYVCMYEYDCSVDGRWTMLHPPQWMDCHSIHSTAEASSSASPRPPPRTCILRQPVLTHPNEGVC